MKVQKIGTRGLLFIFPNYKPFPQVDLTIQIYVINGNKHIYICDTGLEIDQMNELKQGLKEQNLGDKSIIIFNTHFHSDHTGGNKAFKSAQTVSHILCQEKLMPITKSDKEKEGSGLDDDLVSFPSFAFQKRLIFHDDNVEFFHSPGHSEDSASCYDHVDKVLIVGDNLVDPIPFITWHGIDIYLETLRDYCDIGAKTIILGHNLVLLNDSFIRETIAYIERFASFKVNTSIFTPSHATWYRWSLIYIVLDLKRRGMIEESQKFLKHLKLEIQKPHVMPIDDDEIAKIEKFLNKY